MRHLQIPLFRCAGDKTIFDELLPILKEAGFGVNLESNIFTIIDERKKEEIKTIGGGVNGKRKHIGEDLPKDRQNKGTASK